MMSFSRPALLASLLLGLAACSPVVRTHGNMVDPERLSQIHTGVSRQADVAALLGTPTAEGTFNPNEWYYIGQRTEQTAFLAPAVTDRNVVRVTFNPTTGTVAKVEQLDASAGQTVDPVARITPTSGHDLTVLEQVMGNVGRFNKPEDK